MTSKSSSQNALEPVSPMAETQPPKASPTAETAGSPAQSSPEAELLNQLGLQGGKGLDIRLVLDSPSSGLDNAKAILSIVQGIGVLSLVLLVALAPGTVTRWAEKSPFSELFGAKLKSQKELVEAIAKGKEKIEEEKAILAQQQTEVQQIKETVQSDLAELKQEAEKALGDDSQELQNLVTSVNSLENSLEQIEPTLSTAQSTLANTESELSTAQSDLQRSERQSDSEAEAEEPIAETGEWLLIISADSTLELAEASLAKAQAQGYERAGIVQTEALFRSVIPFASKAEAEEARSLSISQASQNNLVRSAKRWCPEWLTRSEETIVRCTPQ